jgi:hypothetical protein
MKVMVNEIMMKDQNVFYGIHVRGLVYNELECSVAYLQLFVYPYVHGLVYMYP